MELSDIVKGLHDIARNVATGILFASLLSPSAQALRIETRDGIEIKVNHAEQKWKNMYHHSDEDEARFKDMITKTKEESYKRPTIVVDKAAYELVVFSEGKDVSRFPIELSSDPILPKECEGDMKVPEGMYRVSEVKPGKKTSYHLAFLLNYPNSKDKAERTQRNCTDNKLGSLIEIHGKGSGKASYEKGSYGNWTEGCIALSNSQMNMLARYVKSNTMVTIVRYGLHDSTMYEKIHASK